ncbi:MAG: cell division topological specificity factor MinE [Ardenticatenales bacterium]|nr:cell division topological specificity factor MinE [Ardenticatenales bacterium]
MGFWDKLLGRQPSSGKVAKDRLQLVLVHDRSGLSPEMIEQMRDELIAVLSKYVEINHEEMEISLTQGRGQNKLIANIPIRPPRVGRTP